MHLPNTEPIDVTFAFTFIRVGRVTGTFVLWRTAAGAPENSEVVESLIDTFARKLAEEEAKLSD